MPGRHADHLWPQEECEAQQSVNHQRTASVRLRGDRFVKALHENLEAAEFRRELGALFFNQCQDPNPGVSHDAALNSTPKRTKSSKTRLRLRGGVEFEVHEGVVRVVRGPIDLESAHAHLFTTDRVTIESLLPTIEIRDGMLDPENVHSDPPRG